MVLNDNKELKMCVTCDILMLHWTRAGCFHFHLLLTFLSSSFLSTLKLFSTAQSVLIRLSRPLAACLAASPPRRQRCPAHTYFLFPLKVTSTSTSPPFTSPSPVRVEHLSPPPPHTSCGLGCAELSVPGRACQAARLGQRGGQGKWSGCRRGSSRPPTTEQRSPSTD